MSSSRLCAHRDIEPINQTLYRAYIRIDDFDPLYSISSASSCSSLRFKLLQCIVISILIDKNHKLFIFKEKKNVCADFDADNNKRPQPS